MGSKPRRAMIQIQNVSEEQPKQRGSKLGIPSGMDYTMCDPSTEVPVRSRPHSTSLRLVGSLEHLKRKISTAEPFYDWAVVGMCEPTS